jgi:hypothetical protein
MRTTLVFQGVPELILQKAVRVGLARSKTDALRLGLLALNREYHLVESEEMNLVARKLQREEAEMKRKGERYLSKAHALAPYR